MPIKLIIADDQKMFLEGLVLLFSNFDEVQLVGQAENGIELVDLTEKTSPDVIITDIGMPQMDGIEATTLLAQKYPRLPIIALTMFNEDHYLVDMLKAGAKGYISKSTGKNELMEAIRSVNEGGYYFCSSTSPKLARLLAASQIGFFAPHAPDKFTEKERDIIQLICREFSSKQIAPLIGLSQRTVENYRNRIMEKMGVQNMVGIVVYAFRHGLATP